MRFAKEFKDFVLKGNVIDLAIAIILGAAFGAIVSSLVDDVITPLLLAPALKAAHAEDLDKLVWGTVKYGKFLSNVIKFIIIALVLFMIIRSITNTKRKKEVVAETSAKPTYTLSEQLLMEIRDGLKR
ncbi:MAG: large conductance mechanosensitive channel protein MscL [Chitinophagaceae bacterium]